VVAVRRVAVPVVDVVRVVAVWNAHMAAVRTVLVRVTFVGRVRGGVALTAIGAVDLAVVRVVDMVLVGEGHMTARVAVDVLVFGRCAVRRLGGHRDSSSWRGVVAALRIRVGPGESGRALTDGDCSGR
jgi:hypothetical protein